MERSEDNLCSNTTNMSSLSKHADGVHKVGGLIRLPGERDEMTSLLQVRKDMERDMQAREDQIEQLENKLKVNI